MNTRKNPPETNDAERMTRALRQTLDVLSEPSEPVMSAIREAARRRTEPCSRRPFVPAWKGWIPLAAAAGLMIAVGTGFYLRRSPSTFDREPSHAETLAAILYLLDDDAMVDLDAIAMDPGPENVQDLTESLMKWLGLDLEPGLFIVPDLEAGDRPATTLRWHNRPGFADRICG